MDFKKLKNGNQLKIKGKLYEVLYVQEEVDAAPPDYKINKITAIYLHNIADKSLLPTNVLWVYQDTDKIYITTASFMKRITAFTEPIPLKQNEISFI